MKKEQLINEAIEILNEYDDVFCECVEELDSYNGFANEWRCYDMCELDDFVYDMKVTEFLSKIDKDEFDLNDNYFMDTIWGLQTTSDKIGVYRDNVDAGDLLDNLLMEFCHIDVSWIDKSLNELLEMLDNGDFEE